MDYNFMKNSVKLLVEEIIKRSIIELSLLVSRLPYSNSVTRITVGMPLWQKLASPDSFIFMFALSTSDRLFILFLVSFMDTGDTVILFCLDSFSKLF